MANFTFVPAFFQQHGEGSLSYGNGKTLDLDAAIIAAGGTYSTENQAIINAIRQLIEDQPGRFIEGIASTDQTVLLPAARATVSITVGGKRLVLPAALATATAPVAGGVTPQLVFVNAGQATARFPVPSLQNVVINVTTALAGAYIPQPAYPGNGIPGIVIPGQPGVSISLKPPVASAVARGNAVTPSVPGEDVDAIPATDLYPDTDLYPFAPVGVSTGSPFYPGPGQYPGPTQYPTGALTAANAVARGGTITPSAGNAITVPLLAANATASRVPPVPGLKLPPRNATASSGTIQERYEITPVNEITATLTSGQTYVQTTPPVDLQALGSPGLLWVYAEYPNTGTIRLMTSANGTSGWTQLLTNTGALNAYAEMFTDSSVLRYVRLEFVNDATSQSAHVYLGLLYFDTPPNQVATNVPITTGAATARSAGVTAAWDVEVALSTTNINASAFFTAIPAAFYDLESGVNPVPNFVFFRASVTAASAGEIEVMSNTTASTSGSFVLDAKSLPSATQVTSSTLGLSTPSPTNSANLKRFVAGALRNQTNNMTGVDARLFLAYRK